MNSKVLLIIAAIFLSLRITAQEETPNSRQARRIIDTAYENVFGEQGSTLRYDVNIIGIYKTHGTIWYKGKKQRFSDERVDTWNDGVTAYMAYRKKKTVEIHHANSDKKDKHSGKFKFSLDDFNYSVEADPDGQGLLVTMKQKKKAKGTIKEVKALVKYHTYEPIQLKLKVAFFWTTVKISNFKAGGISDDLFVFPADKYKNWKKVDKRNEK
jgi:hypothetical protein